MTRNHLHKGAMVGLIYLVCLLPLLFPLRLAASEIPEVTSVFPLSGQQGSTYTAEIRGQNLDKAYAVWFDCDDLKAEVKGIERVEPEAKNAIPNKDQQEERKQQEWRRRIALRQAHKQRLREREQWYLQQPDRQCRTCRHMLPASAFGGQ